LSLVTSDGVALSGGRLAGPPDAPATIVLVHGLMHSARNPRVYAFAHLLARRMNVIVPDLRGHGRSGGLSSLGRYEPLDVEAAVRSAPAGLPVVTVGLSLGGAAVFLHAGTYHDVAGVVGISAPAWWGSWDTPSTGRIERAITSPVGRFLLARLLRTRVVANCEGVPDSRELVASIAPAFSIVVHDPADHYFSEEHAQRIYEWAGEPKELWWMPDHGHATDLLTPALADRLLDAITARVRG